MKIKKWKLTIIIACGIALVIGLIKKQEYTNIMADENNLFLFSVAPLHNDMLPDSLDEYIDLLTNSPIILRVKASGKREYTAKTIKQHVQIVEVYKGTHINEGEEIDILTTRMFLNLDDMTLNLGFTNLLKKDNEYLVFFDEKINSPYPKDNVYRISELLINPVFNYRDVPNTIIENKRYVPYSSVSENEFMVGDSVSLKKILLFKQKLLSKYPQ
ncbi:hypothetical protein [Anaeromicropila populeti]|uniref:Uncharacterized protein n=1 Tax=Anaeromicropila populeti TaxID=37658 RepID=A0A1I6JRS6_9FIRM|nr:hypothetical protein [Anaeromicropila populeti]SFR81664.1 hypothetical protein SAMN05661086_01921 [Anaeromicropila populeti]